MKLSGRVVLQRVIAVVHTIIDYVGVIAALGFLALFVLELVHVRAVETNRYFLIGRHFFDPVIRTVSAWFHWHWPRRGPVNYVPLGLVVAVMIVKSFLDGVLQRAEFLARTALKPKKRPGLADVSDASDQALFKLSAESEHNRAILLKRYREIEEALKAAGSKNCTFLSIDVVGSTKMKVGEEATDIAATFQAYEELVRSTFDKYSIWKQTWTPDGVMTCFLDRELALGAAQRLLVDLKAFNAEKNKLRTPIEVRAGMSEGEVSIFEDTPMEKVADHVVDVAGHMQKFAREGTLWLGEDLYSKLKNKAGFEPTGKEVDGFAAYEWLPQRGEAAAADVAAAPAPAQAPGQP